MALLQLDLIGTRIIVTVNRVFKCITNSQESMYKQPNIGKEYILDEISGIQVKFKEDPYYYLLIDFEEIT